MPPREVVLPLEQPQIRVSLGGVPVPGVVSLEIEAVAYFCASRFEVVFAIGASALTTVAYFAGCGRQGVTIEASLGGFGYTRLLSGQIDNVRLDLAAGTAALCGRDFAALLIDAEISETFANQTSSQIATTIAGRHGLTANVTVTTTAVGQYYELDHARNALGLHARTTTEWSLLVALAQAEGFSLSVTGKTLNFGPGVTTTVVVTPANFMHLVLDMAPNLPTGATVKSWNSRNKTAVSQSVGSGAMTTLIRPNINAAQAQTVAGAHLATLGMQAVILAGTMPADVTLTPGATLVLSGTNSVFDQSYTVEAVARTLRGRSGFAQFVRAFGKEGVVF